MAIWCLSSARPPGSSFSAATAANIGDVATPDDARIEDTPPTCMGMHGREPSATPTQQLPSRDGSICPGMAAPCSLYTCGNWSRTCLPSMYYWKLRSDPLSMDVSYLNL